MKKTEFSKLLTVLITVFFFGVITFSIIVWLIQDRVPNEILSTVAIPFGSVTLCYFGKSAYENGKKIDGNTENIRNEVTREDDSYDQI